MANLLQFHLHDLSEHRGGGPSPHATFDYPYLDHYFTEEAREAFFIASAGRLAGFALTRLLDDRVRHVAEFFILRGRRRHGLGRAAAHLLFRRRPGTWELAFDHANRPAARFWPGAVDAVAAGPVTVVERYPPETAVPGTLLRFDVPAPQT
nr:GNAT family N-acetyltransferase [Streptomonospora sp. PA3]